MNHPRKPTVFCCSVAESGATSKKCLITTQQPHETRYVVSKQNLDDEWGASLRGVMPKCRGKHDVYTHERGAV